MQLYMYEIQYIIHAVVYICVYWVACVCARVRYDQKGWKHHILEKSSSETIIKTITDLCSTKTCACAYDYSCKQLRKVKYFSGKLSMWTLPSLKLNVKIKYGRYYL